MKATCNFDCLEFCSCAKLRCILPHVGLHLSPLIAIYLNTYVYIFIANSRYIAKRKINCLKTFENVSNFIFCITIY